MYMGGVGDHYGLNLPEGECNLLVFVDYDADGMFRASEVAAQKHVVVDSSSAPDRVLSMVALGSAKDGGVYIFYTRLSFLLRV